MSINSSEKRLVYKIRLLIFILLISFTFSTFIYNFMDEKNIKLNIIGKKIIIKGDVYWLSEAFLNIIKNCVEHLEEDGEIFTLKESELALFRRRKVGLIYQFYNLIPTIDVKKNMLLPLLLDGRTPDMKYFSEIVDILGLENRLTHYPGELSGGQQQRVAIGRSLIYLPAIILADEPTGNLDRKNSNEIIELLKLSNKKYK